MRILRRRWKHIELVIANRLPEVLIEEVVTTAIFAPTRFPRVGGVNFEFSQRCVPHEVVYAHGMIPDTIAALAHSVAVESRISASDMHSDHTDVA